MWPGCWQYFFKFNILHYSGICEIRDVRKKKTIRNINEADSLAIDIPGKPSAIQLFEDNIEKRILSRTCRHSVYMSVTLYHRE